MRGCSERPRGDSVRALGYIFWGGNQRGTPLSTQTHIPTYLIVLFTRIHSRALTLAKKIYTLLVINTYSLHPPSHPLHRSCCLDNPPPLRCGQAQILGVLVLLNSSLKSLAGLAHWLQNVWTQLKIAAPSQRDPLSWLLCLFHHCVFM